MQPKEGERINPYFHLTMAEFQVIQGSWESGLIPEEGRTAESRFERMREEWLELEEAMQDYDGTYATGRRAAEELGDVFIVGLSLVDRLGFDIERIILEKLQVNYEKYNLGENHRLKEEGLDWQERMQRQKEQWDLNNF